MPPTSTLVTDLAGVDASTSGVDLRSWLQKLWARSGYLADVSNPVEKATLAAEHMRLTALLETKKKEWG